MKLADGICYTCDARCEPGKYHIAGGMLCEKCVKEAVEKWLRMDAMRVRDRVMAFEALVLASAGRGV